MDVIPGLQRCLMDRSNLANTRIIDKDVDPTSLRHNPPDQIHHLFFNTDIRGNGHRFDVVLLGDALHLIRQEPGANIRPANADAFPCQIFRHSQPDTAGCAGDESDSSC